MRTTRQPPAHTPADPTSGVKSARRVLDLLDFLAARRRGASFPQISEALHLPKSSLHSLLQTLVDTGWVYLHEPSHQYRIGLRLWEVAQNFDYIDNLAQTAHKHLTAARDELNETVQLAILDGVDNVYIAKVEADHPLRLVSRVGSRLPAYATGLGKVLLAHLEPDELVRRMSSVTMQRFTGQTISSQTVLQQRLADIRRKGYGEDEGEYSEGVFCLAVPVRQGSGQVVAAMSCSIPSARVTRTGAAHTRLLSSLTKHAEALSRDLQA